MAARYKIHLKDQSGDLVAIIDDFTNLSVSHRINSIDTCNFSIDDDDPRIDLFELDGQVEIYRSYPAFGVDWYLEFEGFHRTFNRQIFENGNRYYSSYSRGYNDLLNRRIVAYYAGTDYASKSGAGETVMKEYVNENCGPDALTSAVTDWLGDWAKRAEITVDNTNLDSDLTHYPVPVIISSSCGQNSADLTVIFDEVGAEKQKIALTKSDGITQIYAEIEKWDSVGETALLWVSKSDLDLTSASTTTLYIYYDSTQADNTTYVDVIGSRTEVWNANFLFVHHLAGDAFGTCLDSTSNGHDISAEHGDPTYEQAGKVGGYCVDFDGANDSLDIADSADFDLDTATLQAWGNPGNAGVAETLLSQNDLTDRFRLYKGTGDGWIFNKDIGAASDVATSDNDTGFVWELLHGAAAEDDTLTMYVDGVPQAATGSQGGTVEAGAVYRIGARGSDFTAAEFKGPIDEVRLSDIERSAAWCKADKYAMVDDLLSYGSEQLKDIHDRISNGVTAGLTIEADGATGDTWDGSKAYINILSVCQDIANKSGIDFKVRGNGDGLFIFRTYLGQLGDDRSVVGLDRTTGLNGAGNSPVIFTVNRGNMGEPVYSLKRMAEGNFCFVLGEGIERDREIVERSDTDAIDDSPWNRREFSRDARNRSTTSGYESSGDAALEENQAEETFSFKPIQIESTLYGRDYFFGDIITGRYKDIEKNKKLIGIDINVNDQAEDDPEQITVTLGDILP